MLLILTSDKDLTADFLIVELLRRHLPYFRLNAEELIKADFAFALSDNTVRREIAVGQKTLDLDDVEAVWYRRAVHPGSTPTLSRSESVFVAGELRHLAMGLVLNPDVTWVNPIDKVSVAEPAPSIADRLRQLGFLVPRTLVSRDPAALRMFAAANRSAQSVSQFFTECSLTKHLLFRIHTSCDPGIDQRGQREDLSGLPARRNHQGR